MSNKKNRSGTSQDDRGLKELKPNYVSVEERSMVDLLMYLRAYAEKVRFYNADQHHTGFWSGFLNFSDEELLELAEFAEDPKLFSDDPLRLANYSQPHLALLLTFLKLLRYPQEKFAALTEEKVEYFYKNILKLNVRAEVPDQAHVILSLARDVREHLLAEGTLFNAGKDKTGVDLHYRVPEDVVLNKAQVAEVRTLHFDKAVTDLKYVHERNQRGDAGFEAILCLVLGNLPSLPPYSTPTGRQIKVDAVFLRTELYKRIKEKEKDELAPGDAAYILKTLCFRSLKDFQYCLDLLYRELNRGYVGVTLPEDQEWEKAYQILATVHEERIARTRRAELKAIHQAQGFEKMMEFAFGEPEPGDLLYKMPGAISSLQELATTANEAARQYIEHKLCMSVEDFRRIMVQKNQALTGIAGEEVYALLETAWTKKRGYVYPAIGTEIIQGFHADHIFSADWDETGGEFAAFGSSGTSDSAVGVDLGFAVSSPLLRLNEGNREIEVVLSCEKGTFDYDKLAALMADQNKLFTTELSVAEGWREAEDVEFAAGKFIIKPELQAYSREDTALVCDMIKYPFLNQDAVGTYLGFANGKVYQVEAYEEAQNRIYLKSISLEHDAGVNRWFKRLRPKTFVTELNTPLAVSRYAGKVTSAIETFDQIHEGKYFVDQNGKIFLIKRFITASEVEVGYCGELTSEGAGAFSDLDRLFWNKVWETVELEEMEDVVADALDGLVISGVYAARKNFTFTVTDGVLKVSYPEGANVQELLAAWELWKDQPGNDPGRYELQGNKNGRTPLSAMERKLEKSGKIIKRYEALEASGLRITYGGRPVDSAALEINKPSTSEAQASFAISDYTLIITPGREAQTANQIAAAWRLWLQEGQNDPQGFEIESNDEHVWAAAPVSELKLAPLDRQVKKAEVCDSYGVGIRVLYTGPLADKPRLILQENEIDLFDFEISGQVLTVKYPATSQTSAFDLVTAWDEWKESAINDPGNFDLQMMGDGLWRVQARTEKELQASENQVIECSIPEAGLIARFKLSSAYENAIVKFVEGDADPEFTFSFTYSDILDKDHNNIPTKMLTIVYSPLPENQNPVLQTAYRRQQVQALLSKWNREYNKHGFSLTPLDENAMWAEAFPAEKRVNFMDAMNYVCTIEPNGFIVKFTPEGEDPAEWQKAKVAMEENTSDYFAFELHNDYYNNLKVLFIKYPTTRKNRTVAELLNAWKNKEQSLLEEGSPFWMEDGELREFQLVPTGTEKWQLTAITDLPLTAEITDDIGLTDPVNQSYYQYQTADVNGFTLYYTGPRQISPQLTIAESEGEDFRIELLSSYDPYYDLKIGEALIIEYPKKPERRRIKDLLAEWERYKMSLAGETNWIFGFELMDTSPTLKERPKTSLLTTGDAVCEYQAWGADGVCFTYTGHREDPMIMMEPIRDFPDDSLGRKLLWDNGEIFTVTDKVDPHNITVDPETEQISCYDQIKLFPEEAVCLEALKFTIRLDADFPAVMPSEQDGITSEPVIKFLFRRQGNGSSQDGVADFYACFKSVCLERIDLSVKVQGLKDIKMRGDLALINPDNAFAPFGQAPEAPARFYFANSEICTKKLDAMVVNVNWAKNELLTDDGLPDLEKHYFAYSHCGLDRVGTIKNEDFEVKLAFLDKRAWVPIGDEAQELFQRSWTYREFSKQTYQGGLFPGQPELPKDPLEWPRYYQLQLVKQGFLRNVHGQVLAAVTEAARRSEAARNLYDTIKDEINNYEEQVKAAKLAEAEAREKGDAYYPQPIREARRLPAIPANELEIGSLVVKDPYTPVIHSMSIDYQASTWMALTTASGQLWPGEMPLRVFRFNPFGYETLEKASVEERVFMLPQYEHEGYLLIGLKDVAPLQTVSLLFQMISGSGDVNLTAPEITWSYLADNKWVPFSAAEILKDKTGGLQDTGIIQFQIPSTATGENTVLPSGLYWIRAEASENIGAVPNILAIKAGAVCLTYLNRNNDPEHLATPLPANRITELTVRDAAIKRVDQPYTSFNGQQKETKVEFNVRVSERLKHKNRALTLDDYEKLILTRFPQIYKVKCLPQDELTSFDSTWNRGEVVAVVILKNSNAFPFFPLKPKAPANLLVEIEQYMQRLMPSQVQFRVVNPRFEEVRYRLAVKFVDGADQGFCLHRLNEDLKRTLSPWAYEKEADLAFGSTIYSSSLIYFLENLDYVDYVANFYPLHQTIHHKGYTEQIPLFLTEDNAVTTKYPDSILVSADNHVIDVITTEFFDPGAFRGIGHMKVGFDFWIDRPGAVFAVGIGAMEIETWPVRRYAFAGLPLEVKVKATVRGQEYTEEQLSTQLSPNDSQVIWDALLAAGYLDQEKKGYINAAKDPYTTSLKLSDERSLEDYLQDNLSQLTFVIKVTDFDPSAGRQDEFSYTVEALYGENLETAVLNILKAGVSFDGISQYPFIVY